MARPHPWERSYPPAVRWDAPIVPSTLPRLLDGAVAAFGPHPSIEHRDRRISFADLGRLADAFAAALLAAGIGPGDALALYLPNTPDHPVTFFGGARAGLRLVHLSPLDAERELAHKLGDSGARVLVTTNLPNVLPMALKLLERGHADRLIVGDDGAWGPSPVSPMPVPERHGVTTLAAFVAGAQPPAAWPRVEPEDVALLQYTGGTTGTPKGAILTHGNLTAAVESYEAWFGPQLKSRPGGQRVICALPLFHIYALTTILLRHIRNGNEILLRSRFDPETVLRDIEVKRATSFPGVPTMWIALANHPGNRDTRLLLARPLQFRRRASAGRGGRAIRASDRPQAPRRLGHDGDRARRHESAARGTFEAGVRSVSPCRGSSSGSCPSTTPAGRLRRARSARSACGASM